MSFSREDLENHPESETPVDLLNMDTILAAEFNYAAQTAFQANEDRARVASFYLVTVGSFLAAILSTQFITAPGELIYGGFSILFLLISLLGIITLFQLARLRSAWHESILAMNQLKDFYIEHTPNYPLQDAFRWRTGSIPPRFKISSISFLLALEICLLGSFMYVWRSRGISNPGGESSRSLVEHPCRFGLSRSPNVSLCCHPAGRQNLKKRSGQRMISPSWDEKPGFRRVLLLLIGSNSNNDEQAKQYSHQDKAGRDIAARALLVLFHLQA